MKTIADPTVSVIIATRNRHSDVTKLLNYINEVDHPSLLEVIVIDDFSNEPLILDENKYNFRIINISNAFNLGAPESRNIAASVAAGDILGFLDDDCRPLSGWLDTIISCLLDGKLEGITGKVLPLDCDVISRARQYRYENRYKIQSIDVPANFFSGGNSAIWKEIFLLAGGFPNIKTGADNVLVERLADINKYVYFVPSLRIAHRNSKGFMIAVREAWRSGRLTSSVSIFVGVKKIYFTIKQQPWFEDPIPSIVNVFLQIVNFSANSFKLD